MKLAARLYDGDSILRYDSPATPEPTAPTLEVRFTFKQLWNALERGLERLRRSELEAYLARATDHADLERRIRRVERGARTMSA